MNQHGGGYVPGGVNPYAVSTSGSNQHLDIKSLTDDRHRSLTVAVTYLGNNNLINRRTLPCQSNLTHISTKGNINIHSLLLNSTHNINPHSLVLNRFVYQ